jgi:hypothetical protein
MTDIVFVDTETLGLHRKAPIWEFAALRRDAETGAECELHLFIDHSPGKWLIGLPQEFAVDYWYRYSTAVQQGNVTPADRAAQMINEFMHGRPHIIGAVPSFDTERLARLLRKAGIAEPPWHYHLIDIENVVLGYLHGVVARAVDEARMRGEDPEPALVNRQLKFPLKSDELSCAVGVLPELYARHTAMGDVKWCAAQWDAITGGANR